MAPFALTKSTRTYGWSAAAALPARRSAASFSSRLACPGTHWRATETPRSPSACSSYHTSAAKAVICRLCLSPGAGGQASSRLEAAPVVVVVVIPPTPLSGRSQSALEGSVCGPQGRHDDTAPHVLRARLDGAQQSVSGAHQGRAAQQHMPRRVCFLPADRAEGSIAALVLALVAVPGGAQPDPVSPLGGDGPMSGSELVSVHSR